MGVKITIGLGVFDTAPAVDGKTWLLWMTRQTVATRRIYRHVVSWDCAAPTDPALLPTSWDMPPVLVYGAIMRSGSVNTTASLRKGARLLKYTGSKTIEELDQKLNAAFPPVPIDLTAAMAKVPFDELHKLEVTVYVEYAWSWITPIAVGLRDVYLLGVPFLAEAVLFVDGHCGEAPGIRPVGRYHLGYFQNDKATGDAANLLSEHVRAESRLMQWNFPRFLRIHSLLRYDRLRRESRLP